MASRGPFDVAQQLDLLLQQFRSETKPRSCIPVAMTVVLLLNVAVPSQHVRSGLDFARIILSFHRNVKCTIKSCVPHMKDTHQCRKQRNHFMAEMKKRYSTVCSKACKKKKSPLGKELKLAKGGTWVYVETYLTH